MKINIPETGQKRVVVIGGGFGGLKLARRLTGSGYQVVLVDKNNYHQFQPLFYQVAMAGLEPSAIAFPLRKLFQRHKDIYIRVAEVLEVDTEKKCLQTTLGVLNYDLLVVAIGADTNFFGDKNLEKKTIPMKSVGEALFLRNAILSDYETALSTVDYEERQELIDIVIVGGGATGVEVAGALAEMRNYVLPKDYPEMDCKEVDIYLIQSSGTLLKGMSAEAAENATKFLTELGVVIKTNTRVVSYDGHYVHMNNGEKIRTRKVIWAAGVTGNALPGIPEEVIGRGNRIKVNSFSQVEGYEDIFAVGDIAYMETEAYPDGHPQVAQVAIQQARQLADNLTRRTKNKPFTPFKYKDLGSMATIGRNRAVADLPRYKLQGFFAWVVWLFVHLYALVGVKNRLFVFINWVWNYFTYDQSLRLIIKPKQRELPKIEKEP